MITNKQYYRNLFENAPVPYQSLNEDGTIITVNNEWLDMLKYNREEVTGKFIGSFLTEQSQEKLLERFPLFKQRGWVKNADFEFVTRSGDLVYVIVNGRIQCDKHGNFKATHCILTNVTDKYRAEEALYASELKFKNIVQASPMGMHMYELHEKDKLIFTGANPAADQILGIEHSKFIGKPIEEAFPGLSQTEVPSRYRDIAANGTSWRTEQIEYNEGGINGTYEVVSFQTEPDRMVTLFTDITERKNLINELIKAKERAEESDMLKSAFLANLSHEIRTPMNAILGFTDLLRESDLSGDQKDSFVSIIHKSGQQLLSIINDIIEISRIETGQIKLNYTSVNIDSLISDLYEQLLVTIPDYKDIKLFIKTPVGQVSILLLQTKSS
jgi:PAS domain S-box-containing protein